MSKYTETVELAKPIERQYRPEKQYTNRNVFRAVFGSPTAIAAYALPMALASVVATVVLVVTTPSRNLVYANNVVQFVHVSNTRVFALLVALTVISLAVHAFASAAAQLVITTRLLSRPLRLSAAWQQSARLLPRTLPIALLLGLVVTIEVVAAIVAVAFGAPVWVGVGLLGGLLAIAYPLVYLFSIATVRSLPARSAWREMRAVGRTINSAAMLARIPVALPFVVGAGATALVHFFASETPPTLLATTLYGFATTAVAALAAVGSIAAISRLTLEGLSRQPEPQHIELPREPSPARTRTLIPWVAVVGALVLPFGVIAGAITANPTNISRTAVAEIGDLASNLQTIDIGSDVLITRSESYSRPYVAICKNGLCDPAREIDWYGYGKTMAATASSQLIAARWIVDEPKDGMETWTLEVLHFGESELRAAVDPENDDSLAPASATAIDTVTVVDTKRSALDAETTIDLVINNSGELPVIASLSALGSKHGRESTVSVYRCVDAACSSASKQSIPVRTDTRAVNASAIDLALSDDGTAFITLTDYQEADSNDEDDTALIVAPLDGELTITKVIDGTEVGYDFDFDERAGSRIVLTGDGNPAVLYRLKDTGNVQLLMCADSHCSQSATQTIPGLTSADYSPALTVDATGRPLIATYSADAKSVIVLSCIDSQCTEFENRVVAAASKYLPSALAISISSDGLPIVTINDNFIHHKGVTLGDPARVVICQQSRCGAA